MKHNVMKRTLAGVMAVLTVAAYMPANVGGFLTEGNGFGIVASAEGELQEVDSAEAFKTAVETGTSVKLTEDITTETAIIVAANTTVTVDLNGHSITTTADNQQNNPSHVFFNHGNLTITDSSEGTAGTVNAKGKSSAAVFNDVGATCIVNKGSINSEQWYTVKNLGTMVINDGVFTQGTKTDETAIAPTSNASLIANGWYDGKSAAPKAIDGYVLHTGDTVAELTINGGQFTHISTTACVKNDDYSKATINDGTFTSANGELFQATGSGLISGGNFTGFNSVVWYNADGSDKYEPGVLEISGGTFDTYYIADEGTSTGSLIVSGGNFSSLVSALKTDSDNVTDSITGGTFDSNVSAYVAEGYMQDEQGNVIAKSDYNWVLTESKTYTLEEDMVCKTITVPNGVNATIDMNGHTLTVNQCVNVGEGLDETADPTQYGELTVKNGTLNSYVYLNWYSKMTVNSNATVISDKNSTLLVMAYSTLDVYGTVETTKSGECAIIGWGNSYGASGTKSYGSILNIYNGARIICVNDNAIQHPQDGTINMYGGTVQGNTGIYAKGGNINISGGTVKAVGPTSEVSYNNNGSDTTGDALVIKASSQGYAGVGSVKITGGSFTSENGKAVATYSAPNTPYTLPTGFITGGTFNTTLNTSYIAEGYEQETSGKVSKTKPVAEKLCTITTRFASNDPYTTDIYSLSDYTLPKADYLDGMNFIGWRIDGDLYDNMSSAANRVKELINYNHDFTVEVVYEKINNAYTVEVDSNQEVYYQVSDLVKVKPVPAYSGKFSHWERKDGVNGEWTIVSYNETYSFYMPSSNVELRSIYVENDVSVEEAATAVIESITPNSSEKKVSFVSVINVPKNCTFVKGGLVATSDSSIGANVNANNAAYVKLSTKATAGTKNLKYTWTKSNATANWYVRGYVVYKDSKGVEHTVYSTAVCANSSGIINLS